MKKIKPILTLAFAAVILLLALPTTVNAQAGSTYDLITEVNALRASKGLAAYTIDESLMRYAQTHSENMASIGSGTHTRSVGTTAFSKCIQKNVASGIDMSVSYCIGTVWAGSSQWNTMLGHNSGSVGVGVDFDGYIMHYAPVVIPSGGIVAFEVPDKAIDQAQISYFAQQQQETPVYYNTIIISTPQSDGAIYHIVKEGENLWSIAIAYGTTGAEIMTNTGNSPETTDVYIGQVLTIRRANPATATIAPTPTPTRITPQPTQPAAIKTPIPTKTPYPTATPTTEPPLFNRVFSDNKKVGLTMVGLSTIGLVLVLIFGFLKKK
ncbi:MAG: CAP domain-containing protein [Anaerolineaceae bacterium]